MPIKTKLKLFIGMTITAIVVYYSVGALKGLHVGKLFHSDINWGLALVSVAYKKLFIFWSFFQNDLTMI